MEASVPPDSDENEFDLEALKFKLRRCLRSLKSAGSFALFEQLPNAVSPGLYVKGVGRIGIPLSDRDANAITKAARGTPLGKLNVNHASAWELYTNNFETR